MLSIPLKNTIIEYLKPYHPKMIGVFGSYARNEQKIDSDIDILVDFKQTINLLDLIGIEMDLSDALGIQVDLITERSLHPSLKAYIEKDIEIILND